MIEIDRDNNIVKAHGHVVSHCSTRRMTRQDDKTEPGKSKASRKKAAGPPVFTIVKRPN